jgi:ATP-dependent Clp protease adaptor protein ClpS
MGNRKSTKLDQGSLAQLERKKVTSPPPMYSVWLLNDDYTPMEFVVEVLQKYFDKSPSEAEFIMLTVHTAGRAVCGQYPRDVAETKVARVTRFSREHGHPLQCVLEGI